MVNGSLNRLSTKYNYKDTAIELANEICFDKG